MSILRKNFYDEFARIPNELITDQRLSNGAFRVICLLFSKPDNWKVYNRAIMRELGIKKPHTMSEYWKECLESEWLSRELITDSKDGTVGAYNYSINLLPKMVPTAENGHAENGQLPKMGIHNNTNSLNKTKENKDAALISEFKSVYGELNEKAMTATTRFIAYRKTIKKPVKTIKAIKLYLDSLKECLSAGYDLNELIELMEAKEWQGIKLEWVQKELPKEKGWSE